MADGPFIPYEQHLARIVQERNRGVIVDLGNKAIQMLQPEVPRTSELPGINFFGSGYETYPIPQANLRLRLSHHSTMEVRDEELAMAISNLVMGENQDINAVEFLLSSTSTLPKFEGQGFGSALMQLTDSMVQRAIDVYKLKQNHKLIYGMTVDRASGQSQGKTRKGWTKSLAEQAGYSNSPEVLRKCLGNYVAGIDDNTFVKIYYEAA